MSDKIADAMKNIIAAEVVSSLGSADELIVAIVKDAIERKCNSYDRETIFMNHVHEQIQVAIKSEFAKWVENNISKIRQALEERLNADEGRVIKEIVDQMITKLKDRTRDCVHLRLNVE